MKGDPFANKDWRKHAERFRKKVLPKIAESKHGLVIAPKTTSEFDIDFAMQIGAMILLDKPILLLVPDESTVPPKLARVADKIIEVDMTTEAGRDAAAQRLKEYLSQ